MRVLTNLISYAKFSIGIYSWISDSRVGVNFDLFHEKTKCFLQLCWHCSLRADQVLAGQDQTYGGQKENNFLFVISFLIIFVMIGPEK